MTLELPNQFLPALRLLRALHGDGDERDARIARLALSHLDPDHREHFLSRAVSMDELWELEQEHGHKRAYKSLTRNSLVALRVVFWKLGIITHPGRRHKWKASRCPLVMGWMDKHLGSDPTQSEFACLVCGNTVRVPVGKKGKFICSTCGHRYRLSYNDGCRIAFSRPKRVLEPVVTPTLSSLQQACETLQVSPLASVEEMKTAYRLLLLEYHPDIIRSLGCKIALAAAEKVTKSFNAAWEVIEDWHRQTGLEMQKPVDPSGTVGNQPRPSIPILEMTVPPQS